MTEVASNPDTSKMPVPPAIDAIKQRLVGEIRFRRTQGTSLTGEDRLVRDAEQSSSKAGRSDEVLSSANKVENTVITSTLANSGQLKSLLTMQGLTSFDYGPYRLETDPSQGLPEAKPPKESRIIELQVKNPEFDVDYIYYQNGTFDLQIDFAEPVAGERPQYRSGRNPVDSGLTREDAEIIGTYSLDLLDSVKTRGKTA